MYWMVENKGQAPVECLTLLGLSTSRGVEEKIGQFGTGCKHAISVLLRAGITTIIYSGDDRIEFFGQTKKLKDGTVYTQVCYTLNGDTFETSMTLEFGEIDWTNIHMAVREFVSNAIDAGEPNFKKVDEILYETGKTRVFFRETPEINQYFYNIGKYFLQFSNRSDKTKNIMKKIKDGAPILYRKGVLVREMQSSENSLYDYNLNEMRIDECRNMDDYSGRSAITSALARDQQAIETILTKMVIEKKSNFYEAQKITSSIRYGTVKLKDTWKKLFGDKVVCPRGMELLIPPGADVTKVVQIQSDVWASALVDDGVATIAELYKDELTKDGHEIVETAPESVEAVTKVWNYLWSMKMTNNKPMPEVKNFRQKAVDNFTATKIIRGQYHDGVVYINIDNKDALEVAFEELVHYISGAMDCTRAYQNFTNSVVASFIR
jgi:hypothetical protein